MDYPNKDSLTGGWNNVQARFWWSGKTCYFIKCPYKYKYETAEWFKTYFKQNPPSKLTKADLFGIWHEWTTPIPEWVKKREGLI